MEGSGAQRSLKVMISGGGTGGHIFPAIAIANAIKDMEPGAQFLFVGAEGKMEMEKVPAAGYKIEDLPIRGFQRGSILKNLGLPWRLWRSMRKAKRLVRQFGPHVAVGVGGYASGPLLAVAGRRNVPTLIQEQNSYPGITNRLLARRVDRICVAYDGMEKFFPAKKLLRTGNPIRRDMVNIEGKRTEAIKFFGLGEEAPILLVTGGSQGARSINHAIAKALPALKANGIQVIWQTGKNYRTKALEQVGNAGHPGVKVHDFISSMDLAYAAADLVIARAGAISVSELCIVRKPVILVPLPTAAEDHQTMNARALSDRGAAILMPDAEANDRLGGEVVSLISDRSALDRLAQHMSGLGVVDADKAIAAEVIRLARA